MTGKAVEAARGLALFARLCARRRVDAAHIHISTKGSFARKCLAVAIAREAHVPVVLHVHSGGLFPSGPRRSLLERLQSRIFRSALEAANAVVALTPSRQRRLEQEARISYSCVIPNAPDLAVLSARRPLERTPVVLFLGHLYREKGVYDLLEAFATLRDTHPDLRLVLAGEGREAEPLRSQADRLGLGEVVDLPGWVGPDQKATLLAEAACLVLPSHTEGLPLVLLEAMHAGVPIVATPVGGVPEVVEDGVEALLVPPHDVSALSQALMRIVDDAALSARLSQGARRRAIAEYTPEALAARIGDVYREVLGSR